MLVERGLSIEHQIDSCLSFQSQIFEFSGYEIRGDSVLTSSRIDNYDSVKYCLDVKSNPGANLSL